MAKKPSTIATLKCIAIDAEAMRDAALSRNATLHRKLDEANAEVLRLRKQLEDLRTRPGPVVAAATPFDSLLRPMLDKAQDILRDRRRLLALHALDQSAFGDGQRSAIVDAIDAYVTARPG